MFCNVLFKIMKVIFFTETTKLWKMKFSKQQVFNKYASNIVGNMEVHESFTNLKGRYQQFFLKNTSTQVALFWTNLLSITFSWNNTSGYSVPWLTQGNLLAHSSVKNMRNLRASCWVHERCHGKRRRGSKWAQIEMITFCDSGVSCNHITLHIA